MVARGPGAVGCTHCTKLGAVVPCPVCTHLVCEACAADWATCDQPWGRIVRLGTTGRLIDVDPSGRYGLANFWHGPLRLVDLRALRWETDRDLPKTSGGWHAIRPRLTASARLVTPHYAVVGESTVFRYLEFRSVDGVMGSQLVEQLSPPQRHTGVSATGDWYYYVTMSELVVIVSPQPSADLPPRALVVRELDPLPRKVLQAVHVDAARGLLCAASWGEIIVHRILDEKLEQARYIKTTGDVIWVALGGPYVAARVKGGADRGIVVRRLSDASVVHRDEDGGVLAALSRDGRYLAIGHEDGRVVVHALDTGTTVTFDDHTDDVSLVAFVGDDHLLVTADDDNRVILRPRTPTGYAMALLETELA